jgi:hypothetical protein
MHLGLFAVLFLIDYINKTLAAEQGRFKTAHALHTVVQTFSESYHVPNIPLVSAPNTPPFVFVTMSIPGDIYTIAPEPASIRSPTSSFTSRRVYAGL